MADWTGSRRGRFFARYVDWDTWAEGAEFGNVAGGGIELSALSDTKASGTLDFEGEAPDPSKLLRIYYTFEDCEGESETVAVSTMLVEVSDDGRTDRKSSGTARLESVLKVLKDKEYGAPFTVPEGTNAVQKAVELCESVGLRTNNPTSAYALSKQKVFPAEEANYLAIVNWLLSAAGYGSAFPDANGVVTMEPYVEPTDREPAFTFEAGESSVLFPEIKVVTDWQSSPNAVRLHYETENESITAYALNIDPESKSSLPSRGWREKTLREAVTELEGTSAEQRMENLEAMAASRLVANSAEVERVELQCPFLPLSPNDSVRTNYAGVDWAGGITNYSVKLGDDSTSTVTARRFVRRALRVDSGGEILWTI